MRRMTGLQAALAMIGGGLEGQAAQRAREEEQRRFDEDRLYQRQRDAAASERQALMDAVALAEKGYVEQGERAEMQKRATPALTSALQNAGAAMMGQAPTAVPSAQNQAALRAAAGQFGPAASTVQLGGKTFERAQTPGQERRMVAEQELEAQRGETMRANELARRQKQGDVQEQAGRIKAAFGDKITDAQALAIASGGAKISDFVPEELTPYQKAQLAISQRSLDIQEQRANAAGSAASASSGAAGEAQFPGVTEASDFFRSLTPEDIKRIRPTGANIASVAQASSGTFGGLAGSLFTMPFTNDLEQKYAEHSRAVANAVARKRETGVLSNQDITRYESQLGGVAGQSQESMTRKVARAQAWAEWLNSPIANIPAAQRTPDMRQPGETAAEYAARTKQGGPF